MADSEEHHVLKFRLFDGSDIGPSTYVSATSIRTLKERIIAEWPQDKKVVPKAVNDVKLIYSGKILENNKTIAESRIPFGELLGGAITMHVVVQPAVARKKTDKNPDEMPKKNACSCTIL
ncbi:membrane-anchored ubiquitin-fold protein 3-like isoform X2 [Tasmannia lanceolata]